MKRQVQVETDSATPRPKGRVCERIFKSALVLQVLGLAAPLWAIPSPDVVINFVASAGQIIGLLATVVVGAAFSSRKRRRTASSAGFRWAFRVCLALLLVSVTANIFQHLADVDARNVRLNTNLWRSSTEEGRKVGDVNLKSLSFSDQKDHAQGITTEEVVQIVKEGKAFNLIDVREPEEVEMGNVPGAWARRYPDLQVNRTNLIVPGKETILLCESGNRSSELVDAFAKDGIKCRFMIGGMEKWVAEGKPLENEKPRSGGEIRDIPDYPNKRTLLDTPEVEALVKDEKVLFIDVRYPGDFDLWHLHGAVCFPMRKLRSEELWATLRNFPKRPIVAPCYDKRSSFFAMLLGLRLHREGYDFRGRYTVPHEFAVPVAEKEHVAQWKEAQAGKTPLGMASQPIEAALTWIEERSGLAAAIAILVLALRLLILPLTLKADRDQVVLGWFKPEMKDLKARLATDPPRLGRAILSLHRREHITPVRNLFATMAQIAVFALLFMVVERVSANSDEGFLWIPGLASPDPYYILPAVVTALTLAHLLTVGRRSRWFIALYLACAAGLFLLTWKLRAGVNLYLTASLSLLFVQGLLTRLWLGRKRRKKEGTTVRHLKSSGVVLLKLAHHCPSTGNKAARLGRLIDEGLPVPPGFVVTEEVLANGKVEKEGKAEPEARRKIALPQREERQISRAWKRLHADKAAVRSSGLNEDGTDKSYAGVFDSLLNVRFEKLFQSLGDVYGSMQSARAESYAGKDKERGAVVIQKMVDAEYAGVFFTEHPDSTGSMLIELVRGLGESLVSGNAKPQAYRFGRLTGRFLDASPPPINLAPLIELGKRVEKLFGKPQDIEWAYARGRFYLLQARDITRSPAEGSGDKALLEQERQRLLAIASRSPDLSPDEPAFEQNELSELLPRPTPLSHSLMESLWAPGGSTDLACRSLGIPYQVDEDSPPYVNTAFGALYVNTAEGKRRMAKGPGAVASFRLTRSAEAIERDFLEGFLPEFLQEMRLREAIDPARLRLPELISLFRKWTKRFIEETYYEAERINLAADFYLKTARREIEKRALDPAHYLSRMPETVVHKAMALLPAMKSAGESTEASGASFLFLELFGHRAPNDYELAQPRYRESKEAVATLAARSGDAARGTAEDKNGDLPQVSILKLAVERCRRFQSLKEEAKHHCLKEIATLRSIVVEIGKRLELGEGIFYLTIEELPRLADADFLNQALNLLAGRRAAAECAKSVQLPPRLSVAQLEALETNGTVTLREATSAARLQGTRVSGKAEVTGRARVLTSAGDIDSFREGEILVARFTDPTWTPVFPRATGVVTEIGGWLSHAAIVAREYGITAIVGVEGALARIRTGDLLQLSPDGSIAKVAEERRRHERINLGIAAALKHQGGLLEALVRNLSLLGALIEVKEEIAAGQGVSLRLRDGEEVEAQVLRREGSGVYAIEFKAPLQTLSLPPWPQVDGRS